MNERRLNQLEEERSVLHRLLIRNHNQHGNTPLFKQLKGLSKNLLTISPGVIRDVSTRSEKSIRASTLNKYSISEIRSFFSCLDALSTVVDVGIEALERCYSVSTLLCPMLAKMVFVPLYSLLLALNARLFSALATVVLHFHTCFQALVSQVKVRTSSFEC